MIERLMAFRPPTISKKKTGENIRRLRKGYMLTAKQLAAAVYVTPMAVYRWEEGLTLPSIDNVVSIAALFGVMYEDVLATE